MYPGTSSTHRRRVRTSLFSRYNRTRCMLLLERAYEHVKSMSYSLFGAFLTKPTARVSPMQKPYFSLDGFPLSKLSASLRFVAAPILFALHHLGHSLAETPTDASKGLPDDIRIQAWVMTSEDLCKVACMHCAHTLSKAVQCLQYSVHLCALHHIRPPLPPPPPLRWPWPPLSKYPFLVASSASMDCTSSALSPPRPPPHPLACNTSCC